MSSVFIIWVTQLCKQRECNSWEWLSSSNVCSTTILFPQVFNSTQGQSRQCYVTVWYEPAGPTLGHGYITGLILPKFRI